MSSSRTFQNGAFVGPVRLVRDGHSWGVLSLILKLGRNNTNSTYCATYSTGALHT